MPITLKDGSVTQDPRLDRLVEFDERSRAFPVRSAVPVERRDRPRTRRWRKGQRFVIDQGAEGACVGFAITNELNHRPAIVRFQSLQTAERFAVEDVYWPAQRTDPWAGGSYPGANPRYDGTSVLAGLKVGQALGHYDSYRWAFGLQELVMGLSHEGPAVLGLVWHESNYDPDPDGYVRPTGTVVGGHAILARGVVIYWSRDSKDRTWDGVDLDRSYIILYNSWGPAWGRNGEARVTLRDMGAWLDNDGEAAFMVNRKPRRAI